MKKFGLLFSIFIFVSQLTLAQVNIIPVRTDFTGFPDWTDFNIAVASTTYLQLLVAGASTTSPAMNFDNYTSETLDFKARTYGGANTVENEITVWISTNNGTDWTNLGTRTPTTTTLTAMTQFDLSSYSGTQVRIKFTVAGTSNTIGAGIDDITIMGITSDPTITLSSSILTGFTYSAGSGPSDEQQFTVSGSNLTNDIALTPPTNYEISTGTGGSFVAMNPITLTQTDGTVGSTIIYVRLKATLSVGTYDDEVITASSSGASDKTVTCSGSVTAPLPSLPFVENFDYTVVQTLRTRRMDNNWYRWNKSTGS